MNVVIGCAMVVFTTFLHAAAMLIAFRALMVTRPERWVERSHWTRAAATAALVLAMFIASIVESLAWAGTYLALGAFTNAEEAVYFSTVTYTTLGFGDVVMDSNWRLLSSFEAANGIIMFGWTTALIVAAVHRFYLSAEQDADARIARSKETRDV